MATSGKSVDGGTVNLIMWLRDRCYSVSEIARRANVTRVTVRAVVAREMERRGEISKNQSALIQADESDGE